MNSNLFYVFNKFRQPSLALCLLNSTATIDASFKGHIIFHIRNVA